MSEVKELEQLNITSSEKNILEELYDVTEIVGGMLGEGSNDSTDKEIEFVKILEVIKEFKEDLSKTINLGNGSDDFLEELKKIDTDIKDKYEKIMELSNKEEDTGNKTSGPGAIGMIAFDAILYSDTNEKTSSGRF